MIHRPEVKTCPSCGALITPQLAYCRRCKAYLHGTRLEGWIFQHLLGGFGAASPGTAILVAMIVLYYALMVVLAGFDSILGFTSFSLKQLGATHGPSILLGQYWRFVTSIFGHHDALHIVLNVWCLVQAGPIVEALFDRKKMIILYVVSGVLSMVISHLWYVHLLGGPHALVVSAGASGAVSGMIGAAWFGARKTGPEGRDTVRAMQRWAILLAAWGFFASNINNAAHAGGFALGALLAHLTPVGLTQTVGANKALSVAFLGILATIGACITLMLANLRGYPAALDEDMEPRSIFGQIYKAGVSPGLSDQQRIQDACGEAVESFERPEGPAGIVRAVDAIQRCELNLRANDYDPNSYFRLGQLYLRSGREADAHRLARAAHLIFRDEQ